jgi:hypothetical protein
VNRRPFLSPDVADALARSLWTGPIDDQEESRMTADELIEHVFFPALAIEPCGCTRSMRGSFSGGAAWAFDVITADQRRLHVVVVDLGEATEAEGR